MALNTNLDDIIHGLEIEHEEILRDMSINPLHPSTSHQQVRSQVDSDLGSAVAALLGNTHQFEKVVRVKEELLEGNNQRGHKSQENKEEVNQLKKRIADQKSEIVQLKLDKKKLSSDLSTERETSSTLRSQNLRWAKKDRAVQETVQKFCQNLDDDQRRLPTETGNNAEHDAIRMFVNNTLHAAEKMLAKIKSEPEEDGVELDSI